MSLEVRGLVGSGLVLDRHGGRGAVAHQVGWELLSQSSTSSMSTGEAC